MPTHIFAKGATLAALLCLSVLAPAAHAGTGAACSQTPPANDRANAVVAGTFLAPGQSGCFQVWGNFNVAVWGSPGLNGNWVGTVQLERSFDGGTTWIVAGIGGDGVTQAIWNTPNKDVSVLGFEPELGVIYRLDCTGYTSGTINYRLSTSGGGASSWVPFE